MERFVRSDLAAECGCTSSQAGIRVTEGESGACRIMRVQIKTADAAKRIGKPVGHYVTVECGDISNIDELDLDRVSRVLGVELRSMAERVCEKRITRQFSLLVVGLGNRQVTPDAVGTETVQRLSVTRHLCAIGETLFSTVGSCRISAIEPGVPAATGLETVETVRGIVEVTGPDLVVAVDALTARSPERLGNTVQLSDNGVRPASGIGRGHCALDRETLGVPVIALGTPTAVGSDTLAYDLLRRAGVSELQNVQKALELGQRHLVTPGDIDLLVQSAGMLLARTIERAFSVS